jgi:hypothetical protein
VFAEGPERTRVDLGTFLALAVGRDGGAASPDLCRPLALRALLFGVAAEHLHGIKLRLTVTAPDQDLTRLVVATQAYGDSRSLGLSVGLENDLRAAAATLLEPLRGVGGEASAAETTLEIACDW